MKGLSLNVTLSEDQIDKIASLTADKVDYTSKIKDRTDAYYENELKKLKRQIEKRDELIVKKELLLERMTDLKCRWKEKAEKYHEKYGDINLVSETILLLSEKEFENMKIHFIKNNYASPQPREMGMDVRFADFGIAKDIILKNGSFNLIIFNDYKKKESTLTTFTKDVKGYEQDIKDYTFKSITEFHSKLSFYKSSLSKENGTVQAIDWILKG